MQLISPGMLAAFSLSQLTSSTAATRLQEFAQRDEVRSFLTLGLLAIALGQIVTVVAYWLASKAAVEGERATLGNAVKLWLLYLVVGIVDFVGLLLVIGLVGNRGAGSAGFDFGMLAILCGDALLMIALFFLLPMKVYALGFWRTLGFLLLTILISGAGQFGINKALGAEARIAALAQSFGNTDAERQAFARRLFGQDAPDEIDRLLDDAEQPIGKPREFRDRQAAITVIYQKLQLKHRTIRPGIPAETAAYERQVARYKRLIEKLTADAALQQAPPR